ncbi:hypothetical protein [Ruegeria sp. HKCCE3926]|uniref:hypothetical protein n=1 Tax=Ruegeria sp. HKCCE3926 TaxID=2794831 RepID=UPI001AE88BF6|nr:hypothetical protein [Ruegeria sp. HKCCE3926]
MFDAYPDGKIKADSEQFAQMSGIARSRLAEANGIPGAGLGSKLRRHLALSKLNAQLSFYGWAIRKDGTLFEVPVRGEPAKLRKEDGSKPLPGSVGEINEQARIMYTETGKLFDPTTGRRLPNSERHRFGIA